MSEENSCCQKPKKKPKGFASGILYGLLPHTGCIAFIIFTILGVTAATTFLKPLMLSRYFFYFLILISFIFATLSAAIYLKRFNFLSLRGIIKKWKYLSILYGTTLGINLLLFMLIFPIAANFAAAPTGAVTFQGSSDFTLKVDIPCPGHAPLITNELKTINGVQSVKFRFPNYFNVNYDPKITSQKEILSLDVFKTYPALIKKGEIEETKTTQGCSVCGGCSGTCGGTCG